MYAQNIEGSRWKEERLDKEKIDKMSGESSQYPCLVFNLKKEHRRPAAWPTIRVDASYQNARPWRWRGWLKTCEKDVLDLSILLVWLSRCLIILLFSVPIPTRCPYSSTWVLIPGSLMRQKRKSTKFTVPRTGPANVNLIWECRFSPAPVRPMIWSNFVVGLDEICLYLDESHLGTV